MAAAEERLERAVRDARARQRDRRQRLLWTASTAASYALDALFLGLYAAAGTIPAFVFGIYSAGAAAICAVMLAVYASGFNLRFRDPNVIWPQMAAAVALHIATVAAAPQIAFPFLANLFTVFAFGVIWLTLRGAILVWIATVLAAAPVLWSVADRAAVAAGSPAEAALTWGFFSLVLGRCLVLSAYANDMRARLAEGRRRLAASLEQIRELVHYDELTRAFNRRTLMERLEQERSRAERTGVPFSVALIDLDHFKAINDTCGHGAGDEVLKTFAATVHAAMRETDTFGRYGGEEFLVILAATAPGAAAAPLERLRAAVAACDWGAIAPGLALTQSIGVAGFRRDETLNQLLRRADAALYQAKRAGRDRIVIED